jgi:hypothetical protein
MHRVFIYAALCDPACSIVAGRTICREANIDIGYSVWIGRKSKRYISLTIGRPLSCQALSTMTTPSAISKLPPDPYPHLYTEEQVLNWQRSDEYHNSFLIKSDADLTNALKRSEENGLPNIGMLLDTCASSRYTLIISLISRE